MKIEDLSKLPISTKLLLYRIILLHVKSDRSCGYHNLDRGYPFHLFPQDESGGGSNQLFEIMVCLSDSAKESGEFSEFDLVDDLTSFRKITCNKN